MLQALKLQMKSLLKWMTAPVRTRLEARLREMVLPVVEELRDQSPYWKGIGMSSPEVYLKRLDEIAGINQQLQILLRLHYQALARAGQLPKDWDDLNFRSYSQNGEDGLLHFIFSVIGTVNRRGVEICGGNGVECNLANLVVHHGWKALLLDGNPELVRTGNRFFQSCPDTFSWPPQHVQTWISADNVNDLLIEHGYEGVIDLFSLDMDGMDYWIWKAIRVIQPRVVIAEYETMWKPHEAITFPYDPKFPGKLAGKLPLMGGASLGALVKLGREKGYRLIGRQRYCFNAIFMANGVGEEHFPEIPVESCYDHPVVALKQNCWEVERIRPYCIEV